MTFQSLEYLIFLFCVFIIYWTVCNRNKDLQNIFLIITSFVFYGWWDWRFLALLLVTALSTFGGAIWMNKVLVRKKKILILWSTIILNLGILLFFKYCNFFVQSFADVLTLLNIHIGISTLNIILPIGISFYTFIALSYSLDVYNKKISVTKDIFAYVAYVSFFPSILSGPISRAQKQLPQYFEKRSFDYEKCVSGCKLLLMGGVVKLCLADRLGIYVDAVYANYLQHNGITLLFASILYSIQIYADFAGYSLMAIGSGKLLGIDLPINFTRPYFAKTVTDFWRRWHISLTTWFRDYIYFPLGGNRCSKIRWIWNTLIVFIISGLWHGAAYTFLIWGGLHGLCMIIEKFIYGEKIKQLSSKISILNVFRMFITFMIVNFAWILFRIDSLDAVLIIYKKIFTDYGALFVDPDTLAYSFLFVVLIFFVDFIDEYYPTRIKLLNSSRVMVRWTTYAIMVIMVLLFGVLDGGSFIYFQF